MSRVHFSTYVNMYIYMKSPNYYDIVCFAARSIVGRFLIGLSNLNSVMGKTVLKMYGYMVLKPVAQTEDLTFAAIRWFMHAWSNYRYTGTVPLGDPEVKTLAIDCL